MPSVEYKQGSVIYSEGEPLQSISLITKGDIQATNAGYSFRLGKADVLGFCDLGSGNYSHTYTALSDVTAFPHPHESIDDLKPWLQSNADMAYLAVSSMCRQISGYLQYWSGIKKKANGAFDLLRRVYPEYERLCKQYAFTAKKLTGLSEVSPIPKSGLVESWLRDMYVDIMNTDPGVHQKFFLNKPGLSLGFIRKGVRDIDDVIQSCRAYLDYLKGISALFLDSGGLDLFSLISDLHLSAINMKGADEAIEALVKPLTELLAGMPGVDPGYYKSRVDSYMSDLAAKRETREITDAPAVTGVNQDLLESMDIILKYSGCDAELCDKFRLHVRTYTDLPDRNSTEDDMYDLRKGLVAGFYELYRNILVKSLNDPSPPTVVKMFLKFGFVDPTLAGYENANFLYSIADSYKGDPESGIYTISEWLAAVYDGKVEPSISEFELDYQGYVKELKNEKKLDEKEVKRLLADKDGKLRFELDNVFPVVNRVTSGNPSRFTPVFSDHNLQRNIESLLVTAEQIKAHLDEIRSIDFSAFYRETQYADEKAGVLGESITVEVLPNIILMPNAGIRGSMWQEIEGRLRTTPARMFMPICLEGDLKQLVLRLTGEFRWEMCKRIQGSRWGDVTDPSLTSFYTDYLQFYMNNRSISMQTMNAIRNELSSARNNYKNVFVSNYAAWILNESNGSARLNNLAVAILMQFCPFTASIRERLATNMRYNEALTRYNIKQKKRIEHISRVIKMVRMRNKEAPKELLDELEYAKR